jgi:hypothetical protein
VSKRTHVVERGPLPDAPPPPPPTAVAAVASAAAGAALACAGRRRLAAAAPWRHRRERGGFVSAKSRVREVCASTMRRKEGAHRLHCGRGGCADAGCAWGPLGQRGGGGGGGSGLLGAEGVHARRDAHHRVRAAQHPLLCVSGPSLGRPLQSCAHSVPAGCLVKSVQRRVGEVQLVETLHDLFTAHPVSQPSIIARR